MVDYIKSILPRLQQFSKSLNETAIFADVPWAFIDDDGDRVTYIFRRNNELLVSKRGEVTTGHWEYLSVLQSLLIEHGNRKRMYNQGFIDNAVMALKKDGTDELFWLANQQILPDLNLVDYLEQKAQSISHLASNSDSKKRVTIELINPRRLILIERVREDSTYDTGNKVFDSLTGNSLEDGVYSTNFELKLEVKNGEIKKVSDEFIFMPIVGIIIIITGLILMYFSAK